MTANHLARPLNAPRKAGVRLAINLVANAVEISTTHYLVAVVFLRSVEAQMRGGAIEPGDVLVIRERAEPLH